MKVINFFGGPGIGKSTIAADFFVHLKKQHKEVELVTEYAKDMVYEERHNILQDQLYILAKQNRKLLRLIPKGIEYAITDSPIILGYIYYRKHGGTSPNLLAMIEEVFKSYNNINFYLERHPTVEYKGIGRIQQTKEQAVEIDNEIKKLLFDLNISFIPLSVQDYSCDTIYELAEYTVGE